MICIMFSSQHHHTKFWDGIFTCIASHTVHSFNDSAIISELRTLAFAFPPLSVTHLLILQMFCISQSKKIKTNVHEASFPGKAAVALHKIAELLIKI